MAKPIYGVFTVNHSGVARELCTKVIIRDPISKKHLQLERAIWDTGATGSVINGTVAKALNLIPTGQMKVYTANGHSIANTYVLEVHLPNKLTIQNLNVCEGDLGPRTDMLIGMDIIGIGDFTVQNCGGNTQFSFAFPAFEKKYDMIEKAEKLNPRIIKDNLREQKNALPTGS